ncbi:hypothetical protein [Pseudonocardia sp. NPDC049635]|uniref:hypothetical protein n=1 Tax=Pseudonocardia sp. NPDC049635 TaxID=3155506 RepID=UPI0033E6D455
MGRVENKVTLITGVARGQGRAHAIRLAEEGAANAIPVQWPDSVDVSNTVLHLASDEARYVTGVALPADAGFLLT